MIRKTHPLRERFLFSTEEECLTALPDKPELTKIAIKKFLSIGRRLAPSLPCPAGYFNGYGRVYADMSHIELAAMECDDPYLLTAVVEKQHSISAQIVAEMEKEDFRFVLANNNHSGLLQTDCPVWGAHENYLTEKHPSKLTDLLLPFLVTRIYAGAGGIEFPSGDFLAGVRPTRMELVTGGDTTHCRAIHSTAREEHHMGPKPDCFRYHQILGDGHRSHFNLALQFGATALALKAVLYDRKLSRDIARLPGFPPPGNRWVGLLQEINVLARSGQSLTIDPRVVATQRLYLDAARRFAASMDHAPPWVPRILDDWNHTLDAIDRLDRAWLAPRFDNFAKYEFYSRILDEAGCSWAVLPNSSSELFRRLAILDHSYHEFCNRSSIFRQMEAGGLLNHRVCDMDGPGLENEPYVPDTTTRARARARFLSNHCGDPRFIVDWSCIYDTSSERRKSLYGPFAESYGPWEEIDSARRARESQRRWHLADHAT
jgi:hypothetical protein